MDLIIDTITEPETQTTIEPKEQKRKAGRQLGDTYNKKNKFRILYYNHLNKNFDTLGDFPSLRLASEKLNINYNLLSNINLNRSKNQSKYYNIIKL